MSRGELSSEQKAEHATPKSTPTPGNPFGGATTSLAAIPKETSHPEDGVKEKVAFLTTPTTARCLLKRTQPKFGTQTSEHFRDR